MAKIALFEAAELVKTPGEVPRDVVRTLKLFQTVLRIVFEHYHSEYRRDKRGQLRSLEEFKSLKAKLKQYQSVPFVRPIFAQIEAINRAYIEKYQSQRQLKKQNISAPLAAVMAAWNTKNISAILQAARPVSALVAQHQRATAEPLQGKFNPYYIENPLFFISASFLEMFEREQIEAVMNLDLNEYRYSYLPLPPDKQGDFQYLGYYMLKLRNTQDPVSITGKDAKKYFDLAFSGSKYQELVTDITNYLHNNDKALIPKIVAGIQEFPEIAELNEKAKQGIERVYRGVGGEPSVTRILQQDRATRFVATSTSHSVAENFALQRGHLEDRRTRRVEDAVIITYAVGPESILFDTTVFGGLFGEGEVLIDVTKAAVEETETL